jgi:hypothetical protein
MIKIAPLYHTSARIKRRGEAARLVLTFGTLARLDQKQEPERAGGEARGRGRLGSLTVDAATGICKPKGASRI